MALILTSRTAWGKRPSGAVTLNRGSHQSDGLIAWVPCSAPHVYDVLSGAVLTARSGTTVEPQVEGGWGVRCDANNEAYEVTAPSVIRAPWPVTLSGWVTHLGSTGNSASFFGVGHNTSVSAPYVAYDLAKFSANDRLQIAGNSNGTFFAIDTGIALPSAGTQHYAVVFYGAAGVALFVNGLRVFADSTSRSNPTYHATAHLHLGEAWSNQSRNTNSVISDVRIYNRALPSAEVWALYDPRTRWELYAPLVRQTYIDLGGGAAPTWFPRRTLTQQGPIHTFGG